MNYVAILDYAHLDNALFLKSFSEALSAQRHTKGIILHGDSLYTQRLVQSGMLTEDARERSTKDLNHRLVSLLADNGVAAVGINAYQRNAIQYEDNSLKIDRNFLNGLPHNTHLVLSNLVGNGTNKKPIAYKLSELACNLHHQLELDETFLFSKHEADEIIMEKSGQVVKSYHDLDENFISSKIPDDLIDLPLPCRIITTRSFRKLPDLGNSLLIHQ